MWQSSHMKPAVAALDKSNGEILWTRVLGEGKSGHGGVRSCIMDGQDIVCVGYVKYAEPGVSPEMCLCTYK